MAKVDRVIDLELSNPIRTSRGDVVEVGVGTLIAWVHEGCMVEEAEVLVDVPLDIVSSQLGL